MDPLARPRLIEALRGGSCVPMTALAMLLLVLPQPAAAQSPTGGNVVAGSASISQAGSVTNINQSTSKAVINWQSFSIGAKETVNFNQPSTSSVTLNRVIGNEQSVISGALNANGQVFLVNSAGVLFSKGAQVNVGSLVASTLDIANNDFMAGRYTFSGTSAASVINQGHLRATGGGYVTLLGKTVANDGVISARLGTVAMSSGEKITLNFEGNSLLDVTIDQGTLNALVENKRAIRADGGRVILTAKAADQLLSAQVNNTGIVQARTVAALKGGSTAGARKGSITINALGGTANIDGKLDASAPKGGDGGFIETSGERVKIADSAVIITRSAVGNVGTWLIDPTDFNILYGSGDQTTSGIGAKTLQNMLASTNVSIVTSAGGSGNGDINVMAPVTWTAPNSLTLSAFNNVNVNARMTWSGGTVTLNAGKNVYVNAVMTAASAGNFAANYGHVVNANGTVSATVTAGLNSDGTPYGLYTYQGASFNSHLGAVNMTGTGTVTLNGQAYTVIKTAAQLQAAAADPSGHYVLGSHVSSSLTSAWDTPIGTTATPFTGDFNGLGHYVYFVFQDANYVRQPAFAGSGLFGVIGETGVVSNLGIQGTIVGPGSTVSDYVGTLANINHGLIVNDMITFGDVRNGTLTVSGDTVAAISNLGGLVGQNYGRIIGSFYNGSITSAAGVIGGLVGVNESSGVISQSFSYTTGTAYVISGADPTLTYVGGFAGINSGQISTSFTILPIRIADTATASIAGGFVGLNTGVIDQSYVATHPTLNTLYSYGPTLAGFVGNNTGTISNSYSTAFTSTNAASKWTAGFAYLNSGQILNSYAISYAAGSVGCAGGAAGQCGFVYSNTGTLTSAYYAVGGNAVTDGATSGAGVGSAKALTADEAMTFASYGSFSSAVWGASSSGQPILKNLPLRFNSGGGSYGDVSTELSQAASIGGTQVVGFQGGDTYTVAGMFSVIPNNGKYVDAGAYVASQVLTSTVYSDIRGIVAVSPAVLAFDTGTVADKVYDGTTAATIGTPNVIGLVGTDTVVVKDLAGTYASAAVGTGKTVTLTFTLADGAGKASNYVAINTATAAITPAPLTVSSVTADNKTYDGTTTASVSNAVLGGVFGADVVTLSAIEGAFTDADAGSNKSVVLSGMTLSGSGASNYTIATQTVQTTATITPLVLSVQGSKTLDGTATISGSGLAAANVIGGDAIVFSGTATLAGSAEGTQAITSFANLTQNNPNYTLAGASGSAYIGTKNLVLSQVASGTATIDTSVPNVTTITTSDKAIIDWIRFSIAANESLTFLQPSATSVTLNRVIGNEASVIAGSLSANGRIFIVNSAGVMFAAGSTVNVGALVASTQRMANADFLSGNYAFTVTGGIGSVAAKGDIVIDGGGFLALVSQNGVTTSGTITVARDGKAILASAKDLTLALNTADSGLADYAVSNPSGTTAAGGTINLAAVSGSGLLETAGASVSMGGLTLNTGDNGAWSISLPSVTIGSGVTTASFVQSQLAIRNLALNALSGDLTVASAVNWSSDRTLTLGASRDIAINADITATGTNAGLVMNYGGDYSILTPASYAGAVLDDAGNLVANSAPAGTTYASITLSGSNANLTINGQAYTLIRSLSDLQAMNLCANGVCYNPVTGLFDVTTTSQPAYISNTTAATRNVSGVVYYFNVATQAYDIPRTDAGGNFYNPETGLYDRSAAYNGNITSYYYNPATAKYDQARYNPANPADQRFYNPYTGAYDLATAYSGSWIYYNVATAKYEIADYNTGTKQWYDLTTSLYGLSAKNTTLTTAYYNPDSGLYDLWAPYAANGHYAIVKDIDVTGTPYSTSPLLNLGGTLTGLGHTIKGLTITDTTTSSLTPGVSTLGLGLIGNAAWGAVVRDIVLTDANISGYGNVGTLLGYAAGKLTVKNASATGQVTGKANGIGGLIGTIYGILYDGTTSSVSYASADVDVVQTTTTMGYVGGLIGNSLSVLISHTSASGDVTALYGPAGGLIGNAGMMYGGSQGQVSWSYSAGGTVLSTASDPYNSNAATGGLIGNMGGVTLTNSFSTENVTGVHAVGGLVGAAGGTIDGTYATGNVTSTGISSNYTQGSSGTGGLIGVLSSATLTNSWYGNPDGSSVVTALYGAAGNIGGLVGYDAFSPISNVRVNATVIASAESGAVGGIIGSMAYNSSLTGAVFHGSVTGGTGVGGVVGFVGATSTYGNIRVADVEAYGTVNGVSQVGGIVGGGTLSSLSSSVDGVNYTRPITAYITNARSHVDVTGTGDYVGGVLGVGGIVDNSSADGTVNGVNYVGGIAGSASYGISNSYFGGTVVGTGPYVGAIAGAAPGHVTKTFFNKDTAGTDQSTGDSRYFADSTGLTTDQMNDIPHYLDGTINQVLANRAAAAAQAAAEAAAFRAEAIRSGNVIATTNPELSSSAPPPAVAEPQDQLKKTVLDAALRTIEEGVKADDQRRARARNATGRRGAGGRGGGFGATIRSIDVDGQRFNLQNGAPKPGAPAGDTPEPKPQ